MALPLPETVQGSVVAQDILLFPRAFSWGLDLIHTAERLNKWQPATQIDPYRESEYVNNHRNNDRTAVHHKIHQDWAPFEAGLESLFHACARVYKSYNEFLIISVDTGYDLLRYKAGQHFKTHVDGAVGGVQRQLSAIAYLNDDYDGGELAFPRQGVQIKPSAGDIVLFPSSISFPHESVGVSAGVKYAVVTWFIADPRFK